MGAGMEASTEAFFDQSCPFRVRRASVTTGKINMGPITVIFDPTRPGIAFRYRDGLCRDAQSMN